MNNLEEMIEAIRSNDTKTASRLLGATQTRVAIASRLEDGTPLFHFAVASQNVEIVELFLAYGVGSVSSRHDDDESTPLHIAAAWGATAIVDVLVNNGADPTALDGDEMTASDVARANGHVTCADWLDGLRRGLEVTFVGEAGAGEGETSQIYYSCLESTILGDDDDESTLVGNEEEEEEEVEEIPSHVLFLDPGELRRRLVELNFQPGPIGPDTQMLYKRHLARLEASGGQRKKDEPKRFSYALCQHLAGIRPLLDMEKEEEELAQSIEEKGTRTFFNYILIDPRKWGRRGRGGMSFQDYLDAIFYIGKGKRSRPYSHLYETLKEKISEKTRLIKSIWADGRGVIPLHVFQAALSEEAFVREACMIEAIGIHCLANVKRGQLHGLACCWPPQKRLDYGIHLLWRTFRIFEVERPVEIRVSDICF